VAAPPGQESFDRIAGSLRGFFDFDRDSAHRRLVLDELTGQVVSDGDRDDH
jgi:hypothetical protein